MNALALVTESGLVGSLELVVVNLIPDSENTTAETAVELVASVLGKRVCLADAGYPADSNCGMMSRP